MRGAVVNLRGGYRTVAERVAAFGLSQDVITKARSRRRPQTYRVACIVARAAGVPVEKILTGLWPDDRCPYWCTGKESQ